MRAKQWSDRERRRLSLQGYQRARPEAQIPRLIANLARLNDELAKAQPGSTRELKLRGLIEKSHIQIAFLSNLREPNEAKAEQLWICFKRAEGWSLHEDVTD